MKTVSDNFKVRAENPFGAKYNTKIVVDGKVLTDSIENFKYNAMCNPDGDFALGNTCGASVTFAITQPSENLSGKEIEVYQGLSVDGVVEEILLGKFTVMKLTEEKGKCSYECYDRMISKMEMPFFSDLTGSITDAQILNEICEQVGIELENVDKLIPHKLRSIPVGYTRREVIGYMAQLQGKNAIINADGNLELIWYNTVDYVVDDEKIYLDGTDTINDETDYTLEYLKCSVTNSDSSETVQYTSGSGTVGISFENPFMTQEILDEVFSRIGGFSFRPLEVEFLGDFRLEVGDIVTVTTNGVSYVVPIMQLEHSSDGGVVTVIQSVAESDEENQIDTKGPVTKQMERYYAELVLLNKALVNKLSADEADIRYIKTDEIDAFSAKVEDAVIENLDADLVKTEELQATNARVENLEANALTAASATIQELKTGVAEINTLMFGGAGGESIQTEFANAVIAQLGEAQIKSAMIESVSAGQITAGDIITNNVCVRSEGGRLILSDETLQIFDDTMQVRVQIGKDASDDYSINIWDASGNLMFGQGGITENAIKDAIIRDDMISQNANISASKLDIDSLFTEINDSSNTIKATKVYFDAEEQTLDLAFLKMNSSVEELMNTLTNQGTQISVIQGQISSKIWEQDITTAVGELNEEINALNTQYSSLNQTLTGLSSTVGSHTTLIDSLGTRVTATETKYEQLDNQFSWIVKSGDSESSFTLTDRMAELTADIVSLNADVKVNGDMIVDGSITVEKLSVIDLSAFNATIGSWTIDTGAIYDYNGTNEMMGAGLQSCWCDTSHETQNANISFWAGAPFRNRHLAPFRVMTSGKVYASDLDVIGGSVGGWKVDQYGLYNDTIKTGFVNTGAFTIYSGRYTYAEMLKMAQGEGGDEYPYFGVTYEGSVFCQQMYCKEYLGIDGSAYCQGSFIAGAIKTDKGADLDAINSNSIKVTVVYKTFEMVATSGELGSAYGYFEIYDEINALGVNVLAIIPYGAMYMATAGYPAVISPYSWANAYPTVKQWCAVGPKIGRYGACFIVLYKD